MQRLTFIEHSLKAIYRLHRVPAGEIERGARHPRGRADWPRVGILAQRAKARLNLIGVSRCRFPAVDGRTLRVRGLDALDGTPILDIKPYLAEFGPIGDVVQPDWSHEVMSGYFKVRPPAGSRGQPASGPWRRHPFQSPTRAPSSTMRFGGSRKNAVASFSFRCIQA